MAYHEFMNPSPSESNISELETALRERENELAHLRRTMEHNENVIFKVHQVGVMKAEGLLRSF